MDLALQISHAIGKWRFLKICFIYSNMCAQEKKMTVSRVELVEICLFTR